MAFRWREVALRDLPSFTYPAGTSLYRVHQRRHPDPWFYRSRPADLRSANRWDVPAPVGTCYLGKTPPSAFLETLCRGYAISRAAVALRLLSQVELTRPVTLADLTEPEWQGGAGVDIGITAGTGPPEAPYAASNDLAEALLAAGLDGVRWHVRHDLTQRAIGVALFGKTEDPHGSTGMSLAIPSSLVRGVAHRYRFPIGR